MPNLTDILSELENHLGKTLAISTTLGSIGVFWKPIIEYIKDLSNRPNRSKRLEDMLVNHIETSKEMACMINKVHKAIFNGGSNGMMQNLDIMKAQAKASFETSNKPMFICDNRGGNLRVNQAYRELVQVWSDDEIGGTQWMGVVYGELKNDYIDEFERCSLHNEDFFGDVDIKNPQTNVHRGRWKIHAPASLRTDGGCIYVGTFIASLDEVAKDIATSSKWDVRHH